ncbi:phasin family protein [Pseudomonas sp. 10B1]|uniref:phasin family protein n=1 Tax=unclassified Pseudomonas TaxID=196821 RepID=UPI002AB4B939|nr:MULTISPECIES: phasin family protein [unclassified Pseudomonas]MDY7562964.1 phasin family protein [Pseudomonas sp. AB6]MEA9978661.1 phasin family protein [Pseudomonas sp. RTS4]MEA9995449.1 phasin family protein [Pseudomonas sp. AA4]MEB0085293.1 phasin family protein [Pseudomonas sp. RTI1]MEB0125396.1 phasin family protein [Pseudomonas sp. CCC1.2]
MAKVTLKKKVEAEQATGLSEVKLYARKIWLAGLGAYSKAGFEGAEYVKDLIKTGEGVEREGKKVVNEQIEAANSEIDTVKSEVKGLKGELEVQFEKVEHAFDSRVSRALNRFGIASKHDVQRLSAKLDGLTALLERVARKQ